MSMISIRAVLICGNKWGLFRLCASQVGVQKDFFADMTDDKVGISSVIDSCLLVILYEIAFFLQVARLPNGVD